MVPFKNSFGMDFFSSKTKVVMYYVEFLISIVFAIDVILGFRRAFLNEKTGEHVTDPV